LERRIEALPLGVLELDGGVRQAATRTIADLADKRGAYARALSLIHLVPYLSICIAESRKQA